AEGALGALFLDGACVNPSQHNGRYELQSYTASSRPLYKHSTETLYLYYDPDCDGKGSPGQWMLSGKFDTAPSTSLEQDLDNDGECESIMFIRTKTSLPPQNATWSRYCGDAYSDGFVTLSPDENATTWTITTTTSTTVTETTTRTATRAANVSECLVVRNGCLPLLSGVYQQRGWTRLGRPWYQYENSITSAAVYLWYDEQCGAAWYFKSTSPNDNSSNDLGGADTCNFYSRADSHEVLPPDSGWQTQCTDSQTGLAAHQVSFGAAVHWKVSSGLCEILPESQCITTTGFPRSFYQSYEQCSIEVAENNTMPIQVLAFKTGSEDKLMVNGQSYSGTHGPDDVVPQGIVEWSSVAQLQR
ncbi:unnamed protein product, partial [Symbiodinium sp. CCMP2592]